MPRTCSICSQPELSHINSALVRGTSVEDISAKYRVSPDALFRHAQKHLPTSLKEAHAANQQAEGDRLLAELEDLKRETRRLMAVAESAHDIRTALGGIRELTRLVELVAKLEGNIKDRRQVNIVLNSPEYLDARSAVLAALDPYPEARLAVAEVLKNGNHPE